MVWFMHTGYGYSTRGDDIGATPLVFTHWEMKTEIKFISNEVRRLTAIGLFDEMLTPSNQIHRHVIRKLVTPTTQEISTMDTDTPNQITPVVQVKSSRQP